LQTLLVLAGKDKWADVVGHCTSGQCSIVRYQPVGLHCQNGSTKLLKIINKLKESRQVTEKSTRKKIARFPRKGHLPITSINRLSDSAA
jgi:hypothetical protein